VHVNEHSKVDLPNEESLLSVILPQSNVQDERVDQKDSPASPGLGLHLQQYSLTPSESKLLQKMGKKSKEIQHVNLEPLVEESSSDSDYYESESEFENDEHLEQNVLRLNKCPEDLEQAQTSQSLHTNNKSNPLGIDSKQNQRHATTDRNPADKNMSEGDVNRNQNQKPALSTAKKKVSVLKTIFGIFMKKNATPTGRGGKSENEIINRANNAPKKTFFQKLFRFSSDVGANKASLTVNNFTLTQQRPGLSSAYPPVKKDVSFPSTNSLGPRHTDSVCILRKKRLKLFAETQIFLQDSINAYRSAIISQGAISSPLASASHFPFRFGSPNQIPNLISSSRPVISVLGLGYKSTVSESVISPAMSRRKRRLHQSLLDGLDENNNYLKEEDSGHLSKKQTGQIKGILKNK